MEDPRQQKRIEHIFQKTKEELNNFQADVRISRDSGSSSYCLYRTYLYRHHTGQCQGTKIPLTPRDLYLVLGNTVIESAMCEQERFFETFYYRDIMLDQFRKGAKWMAMPIPRHNYKITKWT